MENRFKKINEGTNILGTTEDLKLYNKKGNILYEFSFTSYGVSEEFTYDSNGNQLTYKNSSLYNWEKTYDENGRELTYKNSSLYSWEKTYDENGRKLTFIDSDGISWEKTYDDNGKELTYKHSCGISRGFDIPEYTMAELVEKLGNFKIKK